MNKQEYKIIRDLAWDVLIESKARSLPINLNNVRSLYQINVPKPNASYYSEAIRLSTYILQIFGLQGNEKVLYFAVRMLAPIIVLDALNVSSPMDVSLFTNLPFDLAKQRYKRLQNVRERGTIGMTRQERDVLGQFQDWIKINRK